MPAYKYFTKDGKTKWYANFYYDDWLGKRQHKCKRGFSTKKEAIEWERDFLAQGAKDPDILFSALIKIHQSISCNFSFIKYIFSGIFIVVFLFHLFHVHINIKITSRLNVVFPFHEPTFACSDMLGRLYL